MLQKKVKVYVIIALVLLLLAGLVIPSLADGPIFKFVGTSAGNDVYGNMPGQPTTSYPASVFILEEQGTSNQVSAFCTDLTTTTFTGVPYQANTDPGLNIAMTCEILYILNKYPPLLSGLTDQEAAARQAAIWHYSNGFVVDQVMSPDIYARTQEILDEINAITNNGEDPNLACQALQSSAEIPNLNIKPVSGGFAVIATFPNGDPVQGLEVFLNTGTPNPVITGADGKATFSAPGATLIEAEAVYQVEEAIGTTMVSAPVSNFPAGFFQRLVRPGVENGFVRLTAQFEAPTAIDLASFEVDSGDGYVTVLWETATETDNAGFNLYRGPSPDGPWVQINTGLIAAEGDPVSGANYSFVDVPGRGTFYYQLEDIDYFGLSTLHQPVLAELGSPIRIPWYRPALPNFE